MTTEERYKDTFKKWGDEHAKQIESLLFDLFLEGAKASTENMLTMMKYAADHQGTLPEKEA
jgi:uncharacterized protein YhfF